MIKIFVISLLVSIIFSCSSDNDNNYSEIDIQATVNASIEKALKEQNTVIEEEINNQKETISSTKTLSVTPKAPVSAQIASVSKAKENIVEKKIDNNLYYILNINSLADEIKNNKLDSIYEYKNKKIIVNGNITKIGFIENSYSMNMEPVIIISTENEINLNVQCFLIYENTSLGLRVGENIEIYGTFSSFEENSININDCSIDSKFIANQNSYKPISGLIPMISLVDEILENEILAVSRYRDKKIKVSGKISRIGLIFDPSTSQRKEGIELESGKLIQYHNLQCFLENKLQSNGLKVGENIEIYGTFSSFEGNSININNCSIDQKFWNKDEYDPVYEGVIDTEDLIDEFISDNIKAYGKYKDKNIKVSGIFSELGDYYIDNIPNKKTGIILSPQNSSKQNRIKCLLDDDFDLFTLNSHYGDILEISGIFFNYDLPYINLINCSINSKHLIEEIPDLPTEPTPTPKQYVELSTDYVISANDLLSDFKIDSEGSTEKYLNKVLEISGIINSINLQDFRNPPYFEIGTGVGKNHNFSKSILCGLDIEQNLREIENLRIKLEDKITIIGIFTSTDTFSIKLESCQKKYEEVVIIPEDKNNQASEIISDFEKSIPSSNKKYLFKELKIDGVYYESGVTNRFPFENYILIGSERLNEKIKLYCSTSKYLQIFSEGDEITISGIYYKFENNYIYIDNCKIL